MALVATNDSYYTPVPSKQYDQAIASVKPSTTLREITVVGYAP
jgi:hypothetical protein